MREKYCIQSRKLRRSKIVKAEKEATRYFQFRKKEHGNNDLENYQQEMSVQKN